MGVVFIKSPQNLVHGIEKIELHKNPLVKPLNNRLKPKNQELFLLHLDLHFYKYMYLSTCLSP